MRLTSAGISLVFFGTAILAVAQGEQYVISTYAGGAPPLTPAVGVEMAIGQTQGIAADDAGNGYFISFNCVFRLNRDGVVTRVAGNSRAGFSGDGGPATEAQMDAPNSIALDPAGNLFIADAGNNRIRRVSLDGMITTVAGNGGRGFWGDGGHGASAEVNRPFSLAVDRDGNLFIAEGPDYTPYAPQPKPGNRIRKLSPEGIITTVAGNGAAGFSGDGGPAVEAQLRLNSSPSSILTTDGEGNLFIADYYNGRIRKVSRDGMISTVLDTGASTPDCLASLSGFAFGFRINGYCAVNSVAADRLGNLSFTVYGGDEFLEISTYFAILKASPAGIVTTVGPAADAQISYVSSMAVDGAGNLFIADGIRIRKVSADGVMVTVAGNGGYGRYSGDGGPATAAVLNFPRGVTVDGQGNLFTLEQYHIRRISPGGIITTVAALGPCDYSSGSSAAIGAQLLCRAGSIAADLAGNLFIADSFSIRKLSPDGTITTVAGNNTQGFSGDGGPATDAQLSFGLTVAVDRVGNLFIGDRGNSRLRKVSPDGIITTIAGNGTSGFSGDGGRATSAQLDGPSGIAVDGAGNVFLATAYAFARSPPTESSPA